MADLQASIEDYWARRDELPVDDAEINHTILEAVTLLDRGEARVAEVGADGNVIVHEWLKEAILLFFKVSEMATVELGPFEYHDKIPLKGDFEAAGVRVVPGASARFGSYLEPGVIMMPSYVNIGARVGSGTMVDTWATVASCAQIGRDVHLSGGVGIGGVLEPLQASPTIIEDDCFVGARSEIVEGVVVERGSVISMGVFIGQSTRIYDRTTGKILQGRVPAGSVVVSGSLPSADNRYSLYCAVIVKRVDAQTRAKTSINELLRSIDS
jgi:2,3,4,5-tetrahydropyridine-2-carboxylate N-succinyltransferase